MDRRSIIITSVILLTVLGGGGAATFYFAGGKSSSKAAQALAADTSAASQSTGQISTGSDEQSVSINAGSSGQDTVSLQEGNSLGASNPVGGRQNKAATGSSGGSTLLATTADALKQFDQYKDQQYGLFIDKTKGTGSAAEKGKTAMVKYRGYLTNGTLFDENYSSVKQPLSVKLGDQGIIAGFQQGLMGDPAKGTAMKAGGARRIIVPPAAGYGSQGMGTVIPPDSVLVFDVELISVN
jgi:FKBP-type peptidyl-prolyl cis-trans isomerase